MNEGERAMFETNWKIRKSKTNAKRNPPRISSQAAEDLQPRIAQKAYELFEKRGRIHGNDLSDWFEAERLVKSRKV